MDQNVKIIEKNINSMLECRNLKNIKIDSFENNFNFENDELQIFYINHLSIKNARTVSENYNSEKQILMLTNGNTTCQAKQLLTNLNINIYTLDFFLYNPMEHPYSPKYILLNEKESAELLKICKLKDLPKVLDSDIITIYFGAKINDIFKIIRKNTIYYRVVVAEK